MRKFSPEFPISFMKKDILFETMKILKWMDNPYFTVFAA